MDIESVGEYSLHNLSKINIILGKNGCGKSLLLREVDNKSSSIDNVGSVGYVTPERSGFLVYEAAVEQSYTFRPDQQKSSRSKNQFEQFKQQSVAQFRELKEFAFDELQDHYEGKSGRPTTTNDYLKRLNTLLDQITLVEKKPTFDIVNSASKAIVSPQFISSGESELISLGIECLVFEKKILIGKVNLLLLDEPDVHLHPDLQVRLMHFIRDQVKKSDFRVLIATHSTSILGALEDYNDVSVAFMKAGDKVLKFTKISDVYKKILPVFGAHPLSNIFNRAPVLLLEGEDDERIWQQVVRTSQGRIKLYPVVCGSKSEIIKYERSATEIIGSVYDKAKAFSLRDGDGSLGDLADERPITKLKLQCYSSENLLLTDEVLESLSTNWNKVKKGMNSWLRVNTGHRNYNEMLNFKRKRFDRRGLKLKKLRNDIMGIIGSEKPWEVAVGQVISQFKYDDSTDFCADGSLATYLGKKLVKALLPKRKLP